MTSKSKNKAANTISQPTFLAAHANYYQCLQPDDNTDEDEDDSSRPPSHAIADTGATDHFMTSSYPLRNKCPTATAISVAMPNGKTIHSTHSGKLPLPAPIDMTAHVLPDLSHSLISIGKLCDAGCTATFDAKKVVITHGMDPVLTGPRSTNGLWSLPMHTKQSFRRLARLDGAKYQKVPSPRRTNDFRPHGPATTRNKINSPDTSRGHHRPNTKHGHTGGASTSSTAGKQ